MILKIVIFYDQLVLETRRWRVRLLIDDWNNRNWKFCLTGSSYYYFCHWHWKKCLEVVIWIRGTAMKSSKVWGSGDKVGVSRVLLKVELLKEKVVYVLIGSIDHSGISYCSNFMFILEIKSTAFKVYWSAEFIPWLVMPRVISNNPYSYYFLFKYNECR